MGTSGASVRNQICAAVLARIQGIDGTGNYVTSIGTNDVRLWRKSPFTYGELPEVSINDDPEHTDQGPLIKQGMSAQTGSWQRELNFEIWVAIGQNLATGSDSSQDVTQYVKDAFADLDFAIGATTDGQPGRFWSVSGTRLALNTEPGDTAIYVDHEENFMALGQYKFKILYRIAPFSPNTVAPY